MNQPTFEEAQREMISESLDQAWADHKAGDGDKAFWNLIQAIERLTNLQKHTEQSAARASDVASCLANGIQPD